MCGCSYKDGNIAFLKSRNQLISPIGNRITIYDLDNNSSFTPDCGTRSDIEHIAPTQDSKVVLLIDKDGYSISVNLEDYKVINHFRFKGKVTDLAFSPNDKFLAISLEKDIFIYERPKSTISIEPLILIRKLNIAHGDKIRKVYWSPDSRFFLSSGEDCIVKMHNLFPLPGWNSSSFLGHRAKNLSAFFSADMKFCFT